MSKNKETIEQSTPEAAEATSPTKTSQYLGLADPKGKYFGKWANCHKRWELLAVPEYMELRNKAYEEDIKAMMDIASGFLSEKTYWKDGIAANPSGCESFPICNFRYYYWVLRAFYFIAKQFKEGKRLPKENMVGVIWDAYSYLKTYYLNSMFAIYNCTPSKYVNPEKSSYLKPEHSNEARASQLFPYDSFKIMDLYNNLAEIVKDIEPLVIELFKNNPQLPPMHSEKQETSFMRLIRANDFFREHTPDVIEKQANKLKEQALIDEENERKIKAEKERRRKAAEEEKREEGKKIVNEVEEEYQKLENRKVELTAEMFNLWKKMIEVKERCAELLSDGMFPRIKHRIELLELNKEWERLREINKEQNAEYEDIEMHLKYGLGTKKIPF